MLKSAFCFQLVATLLMSQSSESREGWGRFGSLDIPPEMVALLAGSAGFDVLPLLANPFTAEINVPAIVLPYVDPEIL